MSVLDTMADALRGDGWESAVLGLGGERDVSAATRFRRGAHIDHAELEAMYIENHFAARVVEALPKDALRPGHSIASAGTPEEQATIRKWVTARETELGALEALKKGAFWGRAFGGAVTWIGADDGRKPWEPLREDLIDTVRFLHTVDRRDVVVHRYYTDPGHPKFRKPELFRITPQIARGGGNMGDLMAAIAPFGSTQGNAVIVHESRCLVWSGQPTTDRRRVELAGWDDSVLERAYEALQQLGEDYGAKSLLLGRVSQSVYKIKGLYSMIAGKLKNVLETRIDLMERSRSRARAIVLDLEEALENVTQPLAGVGELLDKAVLRVAAAAEMPVSVLMGQTLATLGETGDGDLEVWTQAIETYRRLELRPRQERFLYLLLLSKDSPTGGDPPEGWTLEYRPLREPTRKESAEISKMQAETDAIRVDKGMASAEAIAMARFAPDSGSDLTLDEAELREALERRRKLAQQPPKDNAELGTVGARASSAIEIVQKVGLGQIPRESGMALLIELFRFTPEVANDILGPEGFKPTPQDPAPGPSPAPAKGEGAGAPQGLPGVNDGGDPAKEPTPVDT